jgi:signal transduction histidine kinase
VLLRARVGASLEKKWLRDQAHRKTMELSQANECLKQTQEQLVAQEKMASLGIFSAGVAHEVKGALTFVVNSSERALLTLGGMRQVLESIHPNFTLEQGEYLDAFLSDLSKHLEQTQKAGRRAEGIVRGTLAGWTKSTELQEDVDLNVLIGEAVNLAYLLGARSMSTFSTSIEGLYDPACPTISCVPGEISRACLNIAQNSFYALHQKRLLLGDSFRPVLRVASRLAGSEVEVRIRDNGIGIAPEILQRIFDPFFTTKTKGSQNGLGLSLSHQIIVEQHNGTIRAESEEGEWTEVVITLPK